MADVPKHDVSETALWVAVFRARESERPDALFRDPFAAKLAGERGFELTNGRPGSPQTSWSVAIRTVVIDELIREAIEGGADTVLSLGAGLDARPYRLELPPGLRWVEVDYPHVVALKDERLAGDTPRCHVERVGLDLARRDERQTLFARVAGASRRAVVLTEGVVPYLSDDEVASLADDLHAQPEISGWITDYFAAELVRALQARAPTPGNELLRFAPGDWRGFFAAHGWRAGELRFLVDASARLGREVPYPPALRELIAYTVLGRASSSAVSR